MKLPVKMGYGTPETLGADRLAGVVGARWLMVQKGLENLGACLVIDAGTCITYDWASAEGEYLGGGISPGLHMRYLALHQQTGKLPLVSHEVFENHWGSNTNESILCGVQQGIAGEVEHQIGLFLEKFDTGNVFITGGDAGFLAKPLKTKIFVEPMLIHYGLMHALLYHENH
jgi:type III pantothenate kinase